MNTHRTYKHSNLRAYVSTQLVIVLAIIIGSAGVLVMEWRAAHPSKHHAAMVEHHRP